MTEQQPSDLPPLPLRPSPAPPVLRPMSQDTAHPPPRVAQPLPTEMQKTQPLLHFYAERPFNKFHHHNLSDSTTASNDSSPTTTISTVDDSSATEPSPGSSPESPPPSTFASNMLRPRTAQDAGAPFFELQKQPPPKKGRNLKNLAVNTSRNPGRAASTTSLPLGAAPIVEPSIASPAFVKPPAAPRRKPSNLGLTLLTPGKTKTPPQEIRLAIPPTPAFGRPGTLRHFQSSPSLPLLSAMSHPNHIARGTGVPALDTIFSPLLPPGAASISVSPSVEEEEEQNFDIPLSKEEKPAAYPDGPICIYDPYIDLYLEPTAEQCRQYDVIMNVASEVRNPLEESQEPDADPGIRIDGGGGIQYAPVRPLNLSLNGDVNGETSPTTPKATPLNSTFPAPTRDETTPKRDPEYIHIKWEHNSDIVPDLLRLVKLIDDRVREGKRILIHCQCGVSRSASLIVAYGLYIDPTQSVQEAYDAVKKKSKWIGPNMNLIMQLQEFRTSLTRGGVLSSNRGGLSPLTPGSALSTWQGQIGHAGTPSTGAADEAVSPGPSSAPSGIPWPTDEKSEPVQAVRARAVSAVRPTTTSPTTSAFVDTSGHIVPVLRMPPLSNLDPARTPRSSSPSPPKNVDNSLASPRATEFAMTALRPPPSVDAADSFGIMSPTSTEFTHTPFDRSSLLASLGMGSVHEDENPRRSLSLRAKAAPPRPAAKATPRLRGRISSPSLREQKQLQSLQAKIEASLPGRQTNIVSRLPDVDEALMSPRATEFTKNPFALPSAETTVQNAAAGTHTRDEDPRSPVSGANPINRSILDVL